METDKGQKADSRALGLLKQLGILLAILVPVFLFYHFFGCPILRFTGIPCPGCGMMRAWGALLRLDLGAAFRYHPLFLLPPLAAYLLAAPKTLPPSARVRQLLLWGLLALFIIVYLLRFFL